MRGLLNHAVKQQQLLKRDLEKLAAAPEDAPPALFGQVAAAASAFQRAIDTLAQAAASELDPGERAQTGARVAGFRDELARAREEMRLLRAMHDERVAETERHALLRRPPHEGAAGASGGASENPYAQALGATVPAGPALERERDVLSRAGGQLDELIERGRAALGDLGEQNDMLRKTQRAIVGVAELLGLSGATVSRIERRAREDRLFFYGGAFALLVCFYLVWRWLG